MNDTYKNIYDSNGNLSKITSNNDTYKYTYDLAKLLREYRFNNFKVKYNYDKNNNISNKKYVLNNLNQNINYTYNDDNSIIKTQLDNNEVNYTYDYLGRITNRNINNSYNTDYTYITNGKRTSLLVKTLKNNNDIYKYKYDKLNNITHIYLNDNLINRYYYDNYNELIKEHDYQNNQTIEYTYDNYGNLLSKKIYELNTTTLVSENTYEYSNTNWVDQLTKFNNESITYDEIGNPLTIGNKTLSWIWGRSLYSYNDGTNNIVYKYNKDNIRTIKWINNTPTYYYLEGNDIIFEETNNNVIYYIRDISGLTGFKYNDNIYYYVKNLQNDIIGILDSNYQEIVKYKYDSWGNILSILDNNGNDISNDSTHIANINPYRYRSYYYDKETNLYYLNSRYYNPKWGRFLNADELLIQKNNGNNLFLYCNNSPSTYVDATGYYAKKISYAYLYEYDYKIIKESETDSYEVRIIIDNQKYTAKIENQVLHFSFIENKNYNNQYAYTISDALYKSYNDIYQQNMTGRTINGITTELKIHYDIHKIDKDLTNTQVADMGTTKNDNNAIVFETIKENYIVKKIEKEVKKNKNKIINFIKSLFMIL